MKSRQNCRFLQLEVEQLEGRVVPATVTPPPTPAAPYELWGSTNWSGISLNTTNQAVTAVSGSWVVPTVSGKGTAYSATWIGIDGFNSSTVEQIGTDSDLVNGKQETYAWVELFGDAAGRKVAAYYYMTPINSLTITAGDSISASVTYESSTRTTSTFLFTIQDTTKGTSWSEKLTTQYVVPVRNSAEWIEEAPSSNTGVLQLANFGSVTFTNAQATIGGKTGTIASFGGTINLIDMGTFNTRGQWTKVEDETSTLNAAGNSFTVQYGATDPLPPSGGPLHAGLNDLGLPTNQATSAQPQTPTTASIANTTAATINVLLAQGTLNQSAQQTQLGSAVLPIQTTTLVTVPVVSPAQQLFVAQIATVQAGRSVSLGNNGLAAQDQAGADTAATPPVLETPAPSTPPNTAPMRDSAPLGTPKDSPAPPSDPGETRFERSDALFGDSLEAARWRQGDLWVLLGQTGPQQTTVASALGLVFALSLGDPWKLLEDEPNRRLRTEPERGRNERNIP